MPETRDVRAGERAEESLSGSALTRAAESASTVLAAQAKATVEARYIIALKQPRDLLRVREQLLNDCKRPAFAEVAIYRKPVGEGIEGPSIRMAEAAARAMRNILSETTAIYDDPDKRIVRVSVTDLEANLTYYLDVDVVKTIERRRPMPGRKPLAVRKNSRGDDVYILPAFDDEILDKERALVSKAMRTCLLRLIPGDILEDAVEQAYKTRAGEVAKDPAAVRRKMVDAFGAMDVTVAQLAEYLGHSVDETTAAEIDALRSLRAAIKDGETTWAEAVDAKRPPAAAPPKTAEEARDKLRAKADEVRAREAKATEERETPASTGWTKEPPPAKAAAAAKPAAARSRRDTLLGDDEGDPEAGR